MKKIVTIALLFVSINLSAQADAVVDTSRQPAITEIGKPNGKTAEMKMNKGGGTLVSRDGNLELIIPSGALSKKTTISIQPITNTMPNGNGQAYRLEPSGIHFQKPLQLVFHYDPEESEDSMQLLMSIAMQDDKGQWYGLKKFTLDTIAKTISGDINHFSDWSKFDKIKLYPSSARLKVKKTMNLSIDLISSEEEELPPLMQDDLSPLTKQKIPGTVTWRANEIIKGNSTVGKIADALKRFITYTAPDALPAQNPVAVTADLRGLTYKFKGVVFKDLRLVSNILIYDDAYEVKMISSYDSPAGTLVGTITYTDTGSFVVSLNGKEAKLIEKVNKNASASLNYSGGECRAEPLKSGTGNIHIMGNPVIKVTPPSSPGKGAWIEISFNRFPTVLPMLQFICPKVTTTNAKGNAMAAGMLPAFPQQIKFEAKEGEQTILEFGKPGGELYAKFTVVQIKED